MKDMTKKDKQSPPSSSAVSNHSFALFKHNWFISLLLHSSVSNQEKKMIKQSILHAYMHTFKAQACVNKVFLSSSSKHTAFRNTTSAADQSNTDASPHKNWILVLVLETLELASQFTRAFCAHDDNSFKISIPIAAWKAYHGIHIQMITG